MSWYSNIHTHTRLTAIFSGLPGVAGTRKAKSIWISLKQETVSGSGISWAICKSTTRVRQKTMPAPHHSYIHKTNTTHLLSTARNSPRLSKRSESVLDALIFLASSCSRSRRDRRRPDDSFSASRGASLSSATASPRDHLNNKHRQTHLHLLLFWHAPPGVCSVHTSLHRGRFWARSTASFSVRL